jgi:hypothetical protein
LDGPAGSSQSRSMCRKNLHFPRKRPIEIQQHIDSASLLSAARELLYS